MDARPEKRVFNIGFTWVERFRGECEHAPSSCRKALHLPDLIGRIDMGHWTGTVA